jgi:hypothetical protein
MPRLDLIPVLASLSLTLAACGDSPLLHHTTAAVATPGAQPAAPNEHEPANDCPLEFPKASLCASVKWDSALSTEDENTGTLHFWKKGGSGESGPYADPGATVSILLWMPAMGHGSSPVTVTPQGEGVYSVSKAYFIMPGDWEVRVQLKQGHQLLEQAVLPVTL